MEHLFDPETPHFATWVWLHDIDLTISLGRTPLKGELSFQDSKCGGNKENN